MKRTLQISEKKESLDFIVWVRAISVFLILLCHLTQTHENAYVVMSSQIFNVGVYIFLVISGFLFGHQGISGSYGEWMIRRAKRIFLPYWIFLGLLITVLLVGHISIDKTALVRSILGLQGFNYVLPGAQHTWFISAILLFYVMTPFADFMIKWAGKEVHNGRWKVLLAGFAAVMVFIAFLDQAPFLTACLSYLMAFMVGKCWNEERICARYAIVGLSGVGLSFALRFVARFWVDGTLLYNHVIALYTHFAAALCFVIAAAWLFKSKPWNCVQFIADLSFEIYLVHYMFIWSPVSVMNATDSWAINCLLVIGISIGCAYLMRLLLRLIQSSCKRMAG